MKKYKTKLLRIRKESDDEYITMTPYSKIITINEIGKNILDESKKCDTLEALINDVSKMYNVEKSIVEKDVTEFYEKMKICGIFEEF